MHFLSGRDVHLIGNRVLEADVVRERLGNNSGTAEPHSSGRLGPDKLGPRGVRRAGQRLARQPVKESLVVRCVRVPHLEVNR